MVQYNFKGNIDNISERQLEFINKVILEQGFKVEKVLFEPIGQSGDNFAANVKRIVVKGENKELRMFAKLASSDEICRQSISTDVLFNNEHVMYTEVLPKLVQLQKAAGVPEDEQLRYAKCYGSLGEAPDEVIILEDLLELDYIVLNKFESLPDECVRSILKYFAILHSFSFVLKKKDPETFDLFKGKLKDLWMDADNFCFLKHAQYFENEILSVLEDNRHKDIVKNKVTGILQQSIALAKYEENNEYSVIQQGDAWTNNMMFKFQEGKLVGSIMIDYQISKNTNPVVDILYMIFHCTDYEARSKNYYNWIGYYYSELDKALSKYGLKANFIYSRIQLDADLKRYGELLFGMCLILTNLIMRDSKDAAKLMEAVQNRDVKDDANLSNTNNMQDEKLAHVKKRLVGIIDSFVEFGLL